jgi:hypothetical protein
MHLKVEHVTVISGTFNSGMGEKFDRNTIREMPTGSFGHWPAGMEHSAWTKAKLYSIRPTIPETPSGAPNPALGTHRVIGDGP